MDSSFSKDSLSEWRAKPTLSPLAAADEAKHVCQHHEILRNMGEYLKEKLYCESTNEMLGLVSKGDMSVATKVQLVIGLLDPIRHKLNLLTFSRILRACLADCEGEMAAEAAVEWLTYYDELLEKSNEAWLLHSSLKILHLADCGQFERGRQLVDKLLTIVNNTIGIDSLALAEYHKAAAKICAWQNENTESYQHGMLYLSYVEWEKLSQRELSKWSYYLPFYALVAEQVFAFGELCSHPLMNREENPLVPDWLVNFSHAFNDADWDAFDKAWAAGDHHLQQYESLLKKKLTLICAVDEAFQRRLDGSPLPLELFAKRCRILEDDVERLLMHAMHRNLIKGTIDGIDKTIQVKWIQGRISDRSK